MGGSKRVTKGNRSRRPRLANGRRCAATRFVILVGKYSSRSDYRLHRRHIRGIFLPLEGILSFLFFSFFLISSFFSFLSPFFFFLPEENWFSNVATVAVLNSPPVKERGERTREMAGGGAEEGRKGDTAQSGRHRETLDN